MPTMYEVFFGPTNRAVTMKLIRYSAWMAVLPLATFYFLYYVVFDQNKDMLGWCGIAAVVAANIVIVAYVLMAWEEDRQDIKDRHDNAAEASGKIRTD